MDVARLTSLKAQQYGIPEDIFHNLVKTESAYNPRAVSPVGAQGLGQLMPETARELGVTNAFDPEQNLDGSARYLRQQYDRFGDWTLAAAAYNAGPGRVQRAGGVPNIPETQAYVKKVTGGDMGSSLPSAADLLGGGSSASPNQKMPTAAELLSGQPKPNVVASSRNGGVTIELPGQDGGIVGNALDAVGSAAQRFGDNVGQSIAKIKAGQGGPGLMDTARLVGDAVNIPLAGVGSVYNDVLVEPIAKGLDRIPMTAYEAPKLSMQGGVPQLSKPRAMSEQERQAWHREAVNTALMAVPAPEARNPAFLAQARQASMANAPVAGGTLTQQVRAVTPQMPAKPPTLPTPSVDDLRAQKNAAYRRAERSGAVIAPPDAQALAQDVRTLVEAKGGADLYPTADKMATRLESLAQKGLSPTQLDDYRGQIYEQLVADGGKEAQIGKDVRSLIDNVMASDPRWAEARAANTRYAKVKEVTDRLNSAEIQADTNLSGAGQALSREKKLRPLIDPKSPQRMTNLTPEEARAMERVVRGTPKLKATRYAGQFLKNRFIQGASLASTGAIGLPGVAAPLAVDVAGTMLTRSAQAQASKEIENLLHLLATGTQKGAPVASAATSLPTAQDALAALQAIQLLRPKPETPPKKKTAK